MRIVLVRPARPGNLGATCRAMANMGLSDLVLVAPRCDPTHPDALGYAARARPLLARARIVDALPAALDGCVATFAASAKAGMYRRQAGVTAAQAAELAADAAAAGNVAFAFGPEDRGLLLRELLHFDRVVEIPADPRYPVLNLAAAVMVVCYELRQACLRAAGQPPWPPLAEPPATDQQKRIFYDRLLAALERIGFFGGQQRPVHLKLALRRVFGRAGLTAKEVDVLIGMAQQIHWYVDHCRPREARAE